MTNSTDTPSCRRCGECCLKGGPALHREDLELVRPGLIARESLMTLRRGEPVHENVAGAVGGLAAEVVKLAGAGGGHACVFYDRAAKACLIHGNSPAECRALFCEDTSALEAIYRKGRLTRADLVDTGGGLWELIEYHDAAFGAGEAAGLAREARAGDSAALARLREVIRAEAAFRREFAAKTGVSAREMDFYFGRALGVVCKPFGLPEEI